MPVEDKLQVDRSQHGAPDHRGGCSNLTAENFFYMMFHVFPLMLIFYYRIGGSPGGSHWEGEMPWFLSPQCVCVNVWMSVSLHWVGWASSHVPALYLHTAASDHSPFPGILVWLPILKRMNPWKNVPRGNITKFLCFGLGFNPHFNKLSELSCDGVLVVPLIQLAFADVRMLTINGDDANSFQKSLHEITFMYYVMSQLYSFMYG